MMKRVISVITSLLMMMLLIGNAALPMTVSAASGDTKLSIEDTTVKLGTTKVSVPVLATSTDIAALVLQLKVTADDTTKQNPVITGATKGSYPDVMVSSGNAEGNERNILWNSPDVTATTFNNESIANVTVQIPSDAVVGSTYTIESLGYDVSTPEQEAEYVLSADSKLSAKITVVDETATTGYITRMEDKNVKAGTIVEVPMMVTCPVNLSAIIATYKLTGDAKIVGFNYKNCDLPANEFQTSQSTGNMILWGETATGLGRDFATEKKYASVRVQIPDNAQVGDQYVLTLDTIDSPDANQTNLIPEKFAKAVLTVADEETTDGLKITVGSKKVSEASLANINYTVKLPVYLSYNSAEDGIAAVRASFTVTGPDGKTAEVTKVEKGSAIGPNGEFQTSVSTQAFGLFNTKDTQNQKFTANDDQELFILTVVLPETAAAGDIYTVNSDFLDIANADQEELTALKVPGEIEIVKTPVTDIDMVIDKADVNPGDTVYLPVHVKADNLQALYGQFVLDSADATITGVKVTSGENPAGALPTVSISNSMPGLVQWVSDQGPMSFDLTDSFISLEIKISDTAKPQVIEVGYNFNSGAIANGTDISDVNINNIQNGQLIIAAVTTTTPVSDTTTTASDVTTTTVTSPVTDTTTTVTSPVTDTTTTVTSPVTDTTTTVTSPVTDTTTVTSPVTDTTTTVTSPVTDTTTVTSPVTDTTTTVTSPVTDTTTSITEPTSTTPVSTTTVTAPVAAEKIDMEIGSVTAKPGETVELPVHISANNLQALYGQFVLDSADAAIVGATVTSKTNSTGALPTIALSSSVAGLIQWVSDEGPMSFAMEDDFITLTIKVSDNAQAGVINVDYKFYDGASADGLTINDVEMNKIVPGQITIEVPATESETTTSATVSDVTTTTATSPVTDTTTVTSPVTDTTTTVTSPVTDTTTTVTSPVTDTTTSTSPVSDVTTTTPTSPVTTTTPVTTPGSDIPFITTPGSQVTYIPVTDVVKADVEIDVDEVEVDKTLAEQDVQVPVKVVDFAADAAYFSNGTIKFNLPEGFVIKSVELNTPNKEDATVSVTNNTVEFTNIDTKDLADANSVFMTLTVTVPEKTDAGKYPVDIEADASAIYRIVSMSTTDGKTTAEIAKIENVTFDNGSITIKEATIKSKEVVEGSTKVTEPTTKFYFSHADKFDLTGLKVTVDVKTIWTDGTEETETIDITDKVTLADNATPKSTYNFTQFKYAVGLIYTDAEFAAYTDGAQIGSFDAFIGQKGDVSLDHKVETLDATLILRENAANQFNDKILPDILARDAQLEDGLLEAAGADTIYDFAKFLGDVNETGSFETIDATYILRFNADKQFAAPSEWDVAAEWAKLIVD